MVNASNVTTGRASGRVGTLAGAPAPGRCIWDMAKRKGSDADTLANIEFADANLP